MKDNIKYLNRLNRILTNEELYRYNNNKDNLIDIGYKYLEHEDFKKAFKIFSLIIRLNGFDPDSLNGIGVALCELGKLKSSRIVLEKTVELFPNDAITLANIAGVYWEEGDTGKALYYYRKSLDCDCTIAETHLNLINLYYELGHLYTAYIACLDALTQFPENRQAEEMRDDILLDMAMYVY